VSRTILSVSALFLGLLGLALMLAPDELGGWLGLVPSVAGEVGAPDGGGAGPGRTLGVELFAAALFAVGVLDWMGRGAIYGGIYGRPIALGNFLLGLLAAVVLLREAPSDPGLGLAALFALHGGAFGWILFRARPWQQDG
jgi:hypothetical protein